MPVVSLLTRRAPDPCLPALSQPIRSCHSEPSAVAHARRERARNLHLGLSLRPPRSTTSPSRSSAPSAVNRHLHFPPPHGPHLHGARPNCELKIANCKCRKSFLLKIMPITPLLSSSYKLISSHNSTKSTTYRHKFQEKTNHVSQ